MQSWAPSYRSFSARVPRSDIRSPTRCSRPSAAARRPRHLRQRAWRARHRSPRLPSCLLIFLSGVEDGKGLSLGFADALITMLGRLDDITVLPTSAILNYAGGTDPAGACRDLGTRHLLQGNVQKVGTHWRVSMHLFDAMTQKSISSEQHDFDLENVFDVQDEIGRQVVESLRRRFPPAVPKSRDRYSSDPEAYDEFMAGLRESYSDRPETLESAIQHLSTAVTRDPEFALAHAWLSYVSTSMLYTFDPRPTRLEQAEHHCRRALMLDPALSEGHLARAFILWSPAKNFQHADALEALQQVLAVQPNLEQAHNRIANDLSAYRTTARGAHGPRAGAAVESEDEKREPRVHLSLQRRLHARGGGRRGMDSGQTGSQICALFSPTTSAPQRRSGSRRATAGDSATTPARRALVHQSSRHAARAAQSERRGARVCSQSARPAAFFRPHASHLLPDRLRVCSTR